MSSLQLKTKAQEAYRTISEVAEELDLPQHVLRFWETRFSQIKPMKRAGGRRYYRYEDVELIKGIRTFLYGEGYTIRGLQKIIKDHGVAHVAAVGRGEAIVEKHLGVEHVEVVSESTRTRDKYEQKLEAKERAEFVQEERVRAPVFARHLMETLNDSFSKNENFSKPDNIIKTREEVKPMQSVYSLKTSYSSQPLVIPPHTEAVSIGRGLSQPVRTQNPSPLVKFRPIEELPEELPAFVKERKFTAPEPIRREEPVFRLREPNTRNHRLHNALLELNECKRMLAELR